MSRLTVEQLLIGWSRTSNGKNVLAKSAGWPSGTRSEWLKLLGDFLDPGIDKVVRRTGETPWLVEFLPSTHGSILLAKVYARESQRAGEFQVHALLDPTATLGPQHLPGLVAAGVLLRERPEDVTRLETIRVEVPAVPVVKDVRQVALALQFVHRGGPLLVRSDTLESAVEIVGDLAAALPDGLAAVTPARSVVTDAVNAEGIAVAVAPWTRGAEGAPTLDEVTLAPRYEELSRRVLAGDVAVPTAGVQDWIELALLDPTAMSAEELARAQTRVSRSAPDEVLRSWAIGSADRVPVLSARLVDRLSRLGLDPQNFLLRTGGTRWDEWSGEAWLQWLESGRALWPGLRSGIGDEGFAQHFGTLLDGLARDMIDPAAVQLRRWPAESLGILVDALVAARNASPELLSEALERLPLEEVRQVVARHWPRLGLQLGLPEAVVQALKPNRGWFGRG